MKNNNYKKALEKIECSEEFRGKMTEQLSRPAAVKSEYSDSVSTVERAKKPSILRYAAFSTAACLAFAAVGVGIYQNMKPSGEELTSSVGTTAGSDDNTHAIATYETTSNANKVDSAENIDFSRNINNILNNLIADAFELGDYVLEDASEMKYKRYTGTCRTEDFASVMPMFTSLNYRHPGDEELDALLKVAESDEAKDHYYEFTDHELDGADINVIFRKNLISINGKNIVPADGESEYFNAAWEKLNSAITTDRATPSTAQEMIDVTIDTLNGSDPVVATYWEGGGQFDRAYGFEFDKAKMVEIISKLRNVKEWRRAKESEIPVLGQGDVSAYILHIAYEDDSDVRVLAVTSIGINNSNDYHVPADEAGKAIIKEVRQELDKLRYTSMEKLIENEMKDVRVQGNISIKETVKDKNGVEKTYDMTGKLYVIGGIEMIRCVTAEGTVTANGETKPVKIKCGYDGANVVFYENADGDVPTDSMAVAVPDRFVSPRKDSFVGNYSGYYEEICEMRKSINAGETSAQIYVTFDDNDNAIVMMSTEGTSGSAAEKVIEFTITKTGLITEYKKTENGKVMTEFKINSIEAGKPDKNSPEFLKEIGIKFPEPTW